MELNTFRRRRRANRYPGPSPKTMVRAHLELTHAARPLDTWQSRIRETAQIREKKPPAPAGPGWWTWILPSAESGRSIQLVPCRPWELPAKGGRKKEKKKQMKLLLIYSTIFFGRSAPPTLHLSLASGHTPGFLGHLRSAPGRGRGAPSCNLYEFHTYGQLGMGPRPQLACVCVDVTVFFVPFSVL